MSTTLSPLAFFDSGPGSQVAEARWRQAWASMVASGVMGGALNEFACSANGTAPAVVVATGRTWLVGHFGERATADGSYSQTISANSTGSTRVDYIILVVDFVANTIDIDVVEGTTDPPTLTRDLDTKWEVPLCRVDVPNGFTNIAANDLTDLRPIRLSTGAISVATADDLDDTDIIPNPAEGMAAWVRDESAAYVYDGANWAVALTSAGTVVVESGTEATEADGSGHLQVGASGGANLGLDGNEIQARDGAGSAAALNLNPHGGDIVAGSGVFDGDLNGNADTATRLATARTITLGGDLSGSQSFDGSSNITITAAVANDSHTHGNSTLTAIAASKITPGAFDGSGEYTFSDRTRFASGSAAVPGLAFLADIDTGIYRAGTNSVGVAVGGNDGLVVTLTGIVVGGGGLGTIQCAQVYPTIVEIAGAGQQVLEAYRQTSTSTHVIASMYSDIGGTKDLKWIVEANGDTASDTGSYGTISDERLKGGIEAAPSYLEKLRAFEVINYRLTRRSVWEEDEDGNRVASIVDREEPSPKFLGFSAQQVQAVAPGIVSEGEDGILSVKTSIMVPMLVQAVQELTDRIEALEAA